MNLKHILQILTALLLAPLAKLHAGETTVTSLVAEPARVELATEQQKLVFTHTDGVFVLSTFVRDGQAWRALFDAGRPLLEGPLFNLKPTRYAVLTNTSDRKTVEFSGNHLQPDYDWTMRVEAKSDNPLFRFVITCHLTEPLMLESPQPVVALWMQQSNTAVRLDQGPDSIYGSAGIPHNYGFPAAYLWDDRREAAVFFNMTPMRWMQPDGVARFHDVRIMARAEPGQTGLGMHFKKLSGRRVPAGDLIVEFFLHQSTRAARPSGMEALDTMMRTFAPLQKADSMFPRNQLTGEAASWEQVARQAMADLSTPQAMAEISAPWRDEPLELVPAREKMLIHPSAQSWDFSTVNNHLTPWLLLAHLHRDADALRVGMQKADALPRFYDPRARLIRHGSRQPSHVGDLEMSWQNFFFHQETLRAASATDSSNFNPAVAGRFLMATTGLRDLAGKADYVFPQWFDPYQKQVVVQNDENQLGLIREPWQAGAYAYLMWQAFDLTADKEYLTEAQRAVEALMERMEFHVRNQVYDRQYKDVAGFPITELFGNAYGIAAAHRLHEATRDPKFLRYSRDFMNTLLRLTFWYEDETTPVSRELRSAGLFYPHGGAHVATPWETSEAHLMVAWALKHDREHPLADLLLKLSNLNRKNSFLFFPAFWTGPVLAMNGGKLPPRGHYFPIEPFYSLEGTGGHRGDTAAYMAGLALWNAWLYEALAVASDREIMVLNLDAMEDYESALSGVERHFLAYNPGPATRTFRVVIKHLPDADFVVTAGLGEEKRPAADLRQGLPMTLKAGEHKRITVRRSDSQERQRQLQQRRAAEYALTRAYQLLQEHVVTQGKTAVSPQVIRTFAEALSACRDGHHAEADAKANGILLKLQNNMPVQEN
ncbi:MAG: hypothetical protein FJ221_13765 [Lentisphaerae bacterium]|nr:hypothetical protein [Lentisphaerota bacterium]